MRGKVKFWNDEKGWGFIGCGEGKDIFVHYSGVQMPGRKTLHEGEFVEFDTLPSEKGPRAVNVVVTNG